MSSYDKPQIPNVRPHDGLRPQTFTPYTTTGQHMADVHLPYNVDGPTRSLMTVDYAHHEIHTGSHFLVGNFADLPINNVLDVQITTPDTTKWAHMLMALSSESETLIELYEGVTIASVGTSLVPINNNRNSTNASGLTVAAILNTTVANANVDTVVAGATKLATFILGSGTRSGGGASREEEIILKQNTAYAVRAIASVAGFVNYDLKWYEHTNTI